MKNNASTQNFTLKRAVKKFALSAFVAVTFVMYALHKPNSAGNANLGLAVPQTGGNQTGATTDPATLAPASTQAATSAPATAVPTATQAAVAAAPTATLVPKPIIRSEDDGNVVIPTPVTLPTKDPNHLYKDGTYTGQQYDAQWGMVQVQAVIQQGKLAGVQVLKFPNDRRTSVRINDQALPYLQQEVIQAQSAAVDLVTGATLTSQAFELSLQSALNLAKS